MEWALCLNLSKFLHFFNNWSLLILFSKFSLYIVSLIDVFQKTSSNCRKLFGRKLFGLSGSVCSQVSATLVIDVRERFFRVAFRPCSCWKRCFVYSVVLEKVVLSRWCFVLWTGREKWGRDWQRDDMADRMTDHFHAQRCCNSTILSHKHAFTFVRACEKTVVFVMQATGVYSVYTFWLLPHCPQRHTT